MDKKLWDAREPTGKAASRRTFLQRVAGISLATVAGAVLLPGLSHAQMQGQSPAGQPQGSQPGAGALSDTDILNFALMLEHLEAEFYNLNGDKAFLGAGTLKSIIAEIRDHENDHVRLLSGALGAKAQPKPQFQGLEAAGLGQFLTLAQTFEDVGVSAYLGAAPLIQDKQILATAAGIMAIEARHAGGIRAYRKTVPSQGNPPEGGDAGITLTEDRESVNRARSVAEVLTLVAPFIVGGVPSPGVTNPPVGPNPGSQPASA